MALIDLIQQKSFLGTEFATWLWYKSELEDGTIKLEDGKACEVVFEKNLLLACEAGRAVASALKGESPSQAPEATAALKAGKKVKRAKLGITLDHSSWEMTLDGEHFDWSGLKIDTPASLPFVEAAPLRLNALEGFHRVFSSLYSTFLDIRLDEDAWKKELQNMHDWIDSRDALPEDE